MPSPLNIAAPRIVVAESDRAVRQLTWALLTRAGYTTHVAGDLATAIAACAADPAVAVVVLDTSLGGNPWDAVAQLRQQRATLGFVLVGDGGDGGHAGPGVARIAKPFTSAGLLDAVTAVLPAR